MGEANEQLLKGMNRVGRDFPERGVRGQQKGQVEFSTLEK